MSENARLPLVFKENGDIDGPRLQEALFRIYQTGVETRSLAESTNGQVARNLSDIQELKTWKAKVDKILAVKDAFADGLRAGRGRVWGVLDRGLLLIISAGSLAIAAAALFVR